MSAEQHRGLVMSPEVLAILQGGIEYSELEKSAGYRRLLTYLEARAAATLEELLNATTLDDRTQLGLVIAWREREKMIADIKSEIRSAMQLARSTTADLDVTTAQREGFALKFNGDDDEGENE